MSTASGRSWVRTSEGLSVEVPISPLRTQDPLVTFCGPLPRDVFKHLSESGGLVGVCKTRTGMGVFFV